MSSNSVTASVTASVRPLAGSNNPRKHNNIDDVSLVTSKAFALYGDKECLEVLPGAKFDEACKCFYMPGNGKKATKWCGCIDCTDTLEAIVFVHQEREKEFKLELEAFEGDLYFLKMRETGLKWNLEKSKEREAGLGVGLGLGLGLWGVWNDSMAQELVTLKRLEAELDALVARVTSGLVFCQNRIDVVKGRLRRN
jgi:hypothetical protein